MKSSTMVFLIFFTLVFIYFFLMISPVLYTGNEVSNDSVVQNVTITSHRGAGGLAPENTISSIDKGMALGADRIEVDVRQTKDKIVVCLHDSKIDRTTNGKGEVDNYTGKELAGFDAGSWFSKEFKNEKIPTLEDILQKTLNKVHLLVEIKEGGEIYPEIEKNVVDIINKYKAKEWVIIQSFNDSILTRIHRIDPEIKLHKLLIVKFPFLYLLYDEDFRINKLQNYDFVEEFSVFLPFTTKALIKEIHRMNKRINVWTVNDSVRINRLLNLGVDGIITDFPNYIKKTN